MFDTKFIDDLARQISDSVPSGVKGLQQDLEKNIHTLLQGALAKLDLVTREEFDTQSQVLLRTRERVRLRRTLDRYCRHADRPGECRRRWPRRRGWHV